MLHTHYESSGQLLYSRCQSVDIEPCGTESYAHSNSHQQIFNTATPFKNGVPYASNFVLMMIVEPLSFVRGRYRTRCIMGYHTVIGVSETA